MLDIFYASGFEDSYLDGPRFKSDALRRETLSRYPVACAVMAAGLSSRFGSLKQLAKLDANKSTLIQVALDNANHSKSNYVFLILGYKAEEIMKNLDLGRAQVILNKDYSLGLSSSVKASISNLPKNCIAVVLMVADQPFVTSEMIDLLITEFRKHGREDNIVSLAYGGKPRNPAIFGRKIFPLLNNITGDVGARDIVKAHLRDVTLINVKEKRVFSDIDKSSDLTAARKISRTMELKGK